MEFTLLGPLDVRDGNASLPLGGRKQQALLARLLLDLNRTVSLDQLVDDLWRSRSQLELAVIEYIGWYNASRLHESLGYLAPAEYEQHWRASPPRTAALRPCNHPRRPRRGPQTGLQRVACSPLKPKPAETTPISIARSRSRPHSTLAARSKRARSPAGIHTSGGSSIGRHRNCIPPDSL